MVHKKFQIFLSTSFSDIRLQTWLSRKLFWHFLFCFFPSSSRSRAMRSPRHNSSKILSNWNEILQTCSGVNVVVPNTFWVYSVQEIGSLGTSKWTNFAMLFQAGFWNIEIFSWIIFCCVEMDLRGLETSFVHGWNGRHVWLILLVKKNFYDVILVKERL